MRAEGSVMAGGPPHGDVTVGRIRFDLRPRPVRESPTRIRELTPEQQEVVEERKAAKPKKPRRRTSQRHEYDRRAVQPNTTPPEVIDEAVELYASGVSARDVGERMGISRATVMRYVKESDVPVRGARKDVPIGPLWADYSKGLSLAEVGRRHGLSNTTVRTRLRDAGYKIRTQGEWRNAVGALGEDE